MGRRVIGRLVGLFPIVVAAVLVTGCGGGAGEAEQARVAVLSSVAPFEEAFEADEGHARLVLLLSPT